MLPKKYAAITGTALYLSATQQNMCVSEKYTFKTITLVLLKWISSAFCRNAHCVSGNNIAQTKKLSGH